MVLCGIDVYAGVVTSEMRTLRPELWPVMVDQAASWNSKGKEVVVADKKGKTVVELDSAPKRPKNYGHFHEDAGPTHFCKVMLAPKLECLLMPLEFTKHFTAVPEEFKPKTNTGCAWRVTV